jgi:hypothetical protein
MNRYFILFGILLQSSAIAQNSPTSYGDQITQSDLKSNLTILASDALEGRETGTRGQKMAAAFISYQFAEAGLKAPVNGSYYQPFNLYRSVQSEVYLSSRGTRFRNFQDFVYLGKDNSGGELSLPVVFAGKGRSIDFEQLQVSGKAVLIMIGQDQDYRGPISLARSKNAAMVLILNTQEQQQFTEYSKQFEVFLTDAGLSLKKPETPNKSSGVFFVAPAVAEKIFNTTSAKLTEAATGRPMLKKIEAGQLAYKTTVEVKTVPTENVLGYLEGTDKKEEVVVITAHYDHIGKKPRGQGDLINNGADDDGSGTTAVLQLAKVFAQAKKDGKGPRRSLLFMTVAGEENGLLGSEYYTQHPVFPLENTVVDLNIDMIGRRDEQHQDSPAYLYVIGADKLSTELHQVSESVNNKYTKLIFDYTYNDENHPARLYYRSDHWNFAQKNIPIIFYFDGIHEDYHQPSDEVDKIEFDLLEVRSQCIFYTAWEIANRDVRIRPDAK